MPLSLAIASHVITVDRKPYIEIIHALPSPKNGDYLIE